MSTRLKPIIIGFALWLVVVLLGAMSARDLQYDNDTWLSPDNKFQQARDRLAEEFAQYESSLFLFAAEDLFTPQGAAQAKAFSDAAKRVDGVVDVVSVYDASLIMGDDNNGLVITTYRQALQNGQLRDLDHVRQEFSESRYMGRLLSEDGRLAAFIVKHDTAGRPPARQRTAEALHALAAQNPLLGDSHLAGDGYLKYKLDKTTKSELGMILSLAAIGIGLFLGALFARLWKMLLVLGVAITAVLAALGVMAALGHELTVVALALPVMLSVIVVADSLHIIRYWEQAIDDAIDNEEGVSDTRQILLSTARAAWLPCLTTSVTSAVGFGVFVFSELIPLRHFGVDSFIGILLAYGLMMGGMFLGLFVKTPGALARRDARRHLSLPDRAADGFLVWDWSVVGHYRPAVFGVALVLSVISLVALVMNAKSESNLLDVFFQPNSEIYQAFEQVDADLGGSGSVSVVFETDKDDYFRQYAPFREIIALEQEIASLAAIYTTQSYGAPIGDIHRALVNDGTPYPQNGDQLAQQLLFAEWSRSAESRDVLAENVNFTFSGAHIRSSTANLSSVDLQRLVGDLAAQFAQSRADNLPKPVFTGHSVFFSQLAGYILDTQIISVALTFCLIFIVLVLQFNVRLALAGMVACGLPILITMGAIAALGYAFDFATVIIASVTMGLSIDDTIHILHRYQHQLVKRRDSATAALREALFIPGRPIVQATFLFCFGAGVFLSSELVILQRFAGFTMLGLVLALLGAVLLLPSLLNVPFFTKTSLQKARATV